MDNANIHGFVCYHLKKKARLVVSVPAALSPLSLVVDVRNFKL